MPAFFRQRPPRFTLHRPRRPNLPDHTDHARRKIVIPEPSSLSRAWTNCVAIRPPPNHPSPHPLVFLGRNDSSRDSQLEPRGTPPSTPDEFSSTSSRHIFPVLDPTPCNFPTRTVSPVSSFRIPLGAPWQTRKFLIFSALSLFIKRSRNSGEL